MSTTQPDRALPDALVRLTERVWYLPHDEPTDRPVLGYVRGDRLALAVDAGASPAHVAAFYRALENEGLPLPDATALTHWHWDHAFGMAGVHGLTVACHETNSLLRAEQELARRDAGHFDGMRRDARGFALEFPPGSDPAVATSDIAFEGTLGLDLGGVTARLVQVASPHTPDAVLVHVPEERTVFMGDATCANYDGPGAPFLDRAKLAALGETVMGLGCRWHLHGHWEPLDRAGVAEDFDPRRTE